MKRILQSLVYFGLLWVAWSCISPTQKELNPYDIINGRVKSIIIRNYWDDRIKAVYEFNEKGHLIHSEDNLTDKRVDDNGNTVYIYYNPIYDGDYQQETWIYNSKGLLVELSTPYGTEEYEYDKNLRINNKVEYSEGTIMITEYEYDSIGNLT